VKSSIGIWRKHAWLLLEMLAWPTFQSMGLCSENFNPGGIFSNGSPCQIEIQLSPASVERLRAEGREYVEGTLKSGDQSFRNVGIHLKGSSGSYRDIDDKPGFTIDFARYLASAPLPWPSKNSPE
jgi:hypothetical protein